MSSKPSAFDALKSGARAAAAAKKKRESSSSLPSNKKQTRNRSITSQIPKPDSKPSFLNPNHVQNESDSTAEVVENQKVKDVTVSNPFSLKKPKNPSPSAARLAELKKKIVLLKTKPSVFDQKTVVCWKDNEKVPFAFLCLALDLIKESKEEGYIVIRNIACNALRTVMATAPDDLLAMVYLMAGRIAPPHEGLKLGIGDDNSVIIKKVLAEAYGRSEEYIKEQYELKKDYGLVAQESRSTQSLLRKPDPLTVGKVFDTFRLIAKVSGQNSQEKKKNYIKALLVAAIDCEPQYLIRLLQAELRIGLAEQTLLAALGQAAVYAKKYSKPPSDIQSCLDEAAKIVKQVYSVLPVYERIVAALLSEGVWNLSKRCNFTLGVPIGPMLAKQTKKVSEIISKFENMVYTCEYKYDGERAQIHYMENGSVEIYSRSGERKTEKFPDIVTEISRRKKINVSSFVLDCELVAYDRENQEILPFKKLRNRGRRDVTLDRIEVDVCIYAFDMLYVNGQLLLQEQLKVRREYLYESFEEKPGFFQFATTLTSNDVEEIQTFLADAVDTSCEGLIIKTLDQDATYEPSKRSNNWLKLKKDYMEGIGDSVDLVPIAAFHGRGNREGVYGSFVLACYDSSKEEFQSICKVGTGFSKAMLKDLYAVLRSKVIPKPKSYYRFSDTLVPHIWFEPTEVWEVKAADLTISPVYCAAKGIIDPNKGISLRFPRFIRVREDKVPELATSAERIAEMFSDQKQNHSNIIEEDEDDKNAAF